MDETIGALSTPELGGFLITSRAAIDAAEAKWLAALAEFDSRCGYTIDGHRDSVSWLLHKCGLARSTAFERLRVAHELRHRPVLAEAFAAGNLSYTKIKTLTRITDMGDDADRTFLAVAITGTHADVQKLLRHWQLHRDQDTPPPASRWDRCGVQTIAHNSGVAVTEVRMTDDDEQRFMRIIDLAADVLRPTQESPMGDSSTGQPTWTQRRADALLTLLEAGLSWLQVDKGVDLDRAVVHALCDYDVLVERAHGSAELHGGIPVSGEAARRLACEAGLVRIITRGASEVLDVGRMSRQWTTAQRRAIAFRWGGRCAFPGCGHRIVEIHHCQPWEHDGETNLDCGVPVCRYHHHLVHEGGWTVSYDPTQRAAIFTGPDGQVVAAPTPYTFTWAA